MANRFSVNEVSEFRQKPGGRLIARYRPGFEYEITELNRDFVKKLQEDGKLGDIALNVSPSPVTMTAEVTE